MGALFNVAAFRTAAKPPVGLLGQPPVNILGNNMARPGWFDELSQIEQAVELSKMLDCLPDEYCSNDELWFKVGMMLQSVGEWTYPIWDQWSQQTTRSPSNYDQVKNRTRWDSFAADHGLTVGSLIFLAKQNGYASPLHMVSTSPVVSPPRKKAAMRLCWMADIEANPPICNWMISDLIPRQGTVAIVARSNAGKSLMSIHAGSCVATGRAFFGRNPAVTGPVIYVASESPTSIKSRLRAYCQHHALDPLKLPMAVVDGVNLSNDSTVVELCQVIEAGIQGAALPAPVLIIFDTLRRTTPDADENSSTEMDKALQRLQAVAEHFDAAVLLTHHYGKDEARGPRGTSALRASFDVEIGIDRIQNSTQHEWKIAKSRDGNDSVTGLFEIVEVELPATATHPLPSRWPVLVELNQGSIQAHQYQTARTKALNGARPEQKMAFAQTQAFTTAGAISYDDWVTKVVMTVYPNHPKPKERGRELAKALCGRNLITSSGGMIDVAPWVRAGQPPAGGNSSPGSGKAESP
jgi:hypothetical protein